MVIPVLIIDFEVGGCHFLHEALGWIEFVQGLDAVRAVAVAAFVNGDLRLFLPSEKGVLAMGAKEIGFVTVAKPFAELGQLTANLAANLGFFLAVVVVEVNVGCVAMKAGGYFRDFEIIRGVIDRLERFVVLGSVLLQDYLEVFRFFLGFGLSVNGGLGST